MWKISTGTRPATRAFHCLQKAHVSLRGKSATRNQCLAHQLQLFFDTAPLLTHPHEIILGLAQLQRKLVALLCQVLHPMARTGQLVRATHKHLFYPPRKVIHFLYAHCACTARNAPTSNAAPETASRCSKRISEWSCAVAARQCWWRATSSHRTSSLPHAKCGWRGHADLRVRRQPTMAWAAGR